VELPETPPGNAFAAAEIRDPPLKTLSNASEPVETPESLTLALVDASKRKSGEALEIQESSTTLTDGPEPEKLPVAILVDVSERANIPDSPALTLVAASHHDSELEP